MILEFEVKDTGPGIPAENVAKLFQPFTQGDGSNGRRFGGTGLGLYLSKRLAQALGGDLILRETSENRGSTFVFTIDAGPFETDVKFYTERSSGATHEAGLFGTRILVVDDSPDNRMLVTRFLEHSQATVETADNGLAAVEAVDKADFDLVLMDIQMPVMDGYEAFKQLRQRGFTKPIVALTAHALHSEREQCFALGFDDHLSKPIDRKVLIETISRLVQKHQTHRPHVVPLRPQIH
jgi:CheY-like chemotaxis protein